MPTLNWTLYAKEFSQKALEEKYDTHYIDTCLNYARRINQNNLPIIYSIDHFSQLVGYKLNYILGASNAQPIFYRKFKIPKKTGGYRDISEPLPGLKDIQYWILNNIIENLPISIYSKAYAKKSSIKTNARFHRNQKIVLRLDIKNFFPSIASEKITSFFIQKGYSISISTLISKLCTINNGLPQGAPTSPYLSNAIMYTADNRIGSLAQKLGIRYTRYADDLFFSGDFNIGNIIKLVSEILTDNGFKLNEKKTRIYRKGTQQRVTGIVVNKKLQAPKKYRKKLRQEIHYIEKNGIYGHMMKLGITKQNYTEHLKGKAHFILQINPKDKDAMHALEILKNI